MASGKPSAGTGVTVGGRHKVSSLTPKLWKGTLTPARPTQRGEKVLALPSGKPSAGKWGAIPP
eukprot:872050-Amphidinium_carterae.1